MLTKSAMQNHTSRNLYNEICSSENLKLAFKKASKRKTFKPYVIEFAKNLKENLQQLRTELLLHSYRPKRLKTFILRDPKTRKISKSDFRDRVVHHALCNIIEPLFDRTFIHDSYANRTGKGTLGAIKRFDQFKRMVSKNSTRHCYILKADIRHYFETVDHNILLSSINRKIADARVMWLIKTSLQNHKTKNPGKGMPLGNLTSQFFANIYLNELDQFVKHKLKAKHYIRYVDDFVILHTSRKELQRYMQATDNFLKQNLALQLHPEKCKILTLNKGIGFLGFRIFYHHKLVRKKNLRTFEKRLSQMKRGYKEGIIDTEKLISKFEGWLAYVSHANTYKYRMSATRMLARMLSFEPVTENSRTKKQAKFMRKAEIIMFPFSMHKTLRLFKKGLSVAEIADARGMKEATVWQHMAALIRHA
jgi:RNA-directed DNA polymerase